MISVKKSFSSASEGDIEKAFYESKSAFESSGKQDDLFFICEKQKIKNINF